MSDLFLEEVNAPTIRSDLSLVEESRCENCNVDVIGRPRHASSTCKAGRERVADFAEQDNSLHHFLIVCEVDMKNDFAKKWKKKNDAIRDKINGVIESRGMNVFIDGQPIEESSDHVILHHSSESVLDGGASVPGQSGGHRPAYGNQYFSRVYQQALHEHLKQVLADDSLTVTDDNADEDVISKESLFDS